MTFRGLGWCAMCFFTGIGLADSTVRMYDAEPAARAPGVTTVEHYR